MNLAKASKVAVASVNTIYEMWYTYRHHEQSQRGSSSQPLYRQYLCDQYDDRRWEQVRTASLYKDRHRVWTKMLKALFGNRFPTWSNACSVKSRSSASCKLVFVFKIYALSCESCHFKWGNEKQKKKTRVAGLKVLNSNIREFVCQKWYEIEA